MMQEPDSSSLSEHARSLAHRLLRPAILDETLASGVFVVRPPSDEDWRVWRHAFVTEVEQQGALVLHVGRDNRATRPEVELRAALATIAGASSRAADGSHPSKAAWGRMPQDTLASIFSRLVEQRQCDVLVILEGVDRFVSDKTDNLLSSLKAARDEVNLRPGSSGRFLLIAVGADQSRTRLLVRDSRQPFFCAVSLELPPGGA